MTEPTAADLEEAKVHRRYVWANTIGSALVALIGFGFVFRYIGMGASLETICVAFLLFMSGLLWALNNYLGFVSKDDAEEVPAPTAGAGTIVD